MIIRLNCFANKVSELWWHQPLRDGRRHPRVRMRGGASRHQGAHALAEKRKDFEKPLMRKTAPPFYAASAGIRVQDSYGGPRINSKALVPDTHGRVVPGLYSGGEASGGGFATWDRPRFGPTATSPERMRCSSRQSESRYPVQCEANGTYSAFCSWCSRAMRSWPFAWLLIL